MTLLKTVFSAASRAGRGNQRQRSPRINAFFADVDRCLMLLVVIRGGDTHFSFQSKSPVKTEKAHKAIPQASMRGEEDAPTAPPFWFTIPIVNGDIMTKEGRKSQGTSLDVLPFSASRPLRLTILAIRHRSKVQRSWQFAVMFGVIENK